MAARIPLPRKTSPPSSVTPPDVEASSQALIFKPEILDITGLSYPTIWAMMRKGEFPRARVVGGKSAWLRTEIEAWLRDLPIRRLKGDPEPPVCAEPGEAAR